LSLLHSMKPLRAAQAREHARVEAARAAGSVARTRNGRRWQRIRHCHPRACWRARSRGRWRCGTAASSAGTRTWSRACLLRPRLADAPRCRSACWGRSARARCAGGHSVWRRTWQRPDHPLGGRPSFALRSVTGRSEGGLVLSNTRRAAPLTQQTAWRVPRTARMERPGRAFDGAHSPQGGTRSSVRTSRW
jgi:hypothetical protein